MTLTTSDGLALAAWYAPGRNGSAIVLVHGSGGNLNAVLRYGDMLRGQGYGVLALILRGHAGSSGRGNALGWECGRDIAAAVTFLRSQKEVNSIGALGISLGGEVLVAAAHEQPATCRARLTIGSFIKRPQAIARRYGSFHRARHSL